MPYYAYLTYVPVIQQRRIICTYIRLIMPKDNNPANGDAEIPREANIVNTNTI